MRGQVKVYQKKIVAKKRRRVFYVAFYSIAVLVLTYCGLSMLSQLGALSITAIVTSGNSRLSSDEIAGIAYADIAGSYFGFFSRSNTLLYPKGRIEKDLLSLPQVKAVDVARSGVHALNISIEERDPVAFWCSEVEGADDCFLMDENGLVFGISSGPEREMIRFSGFIHGDPIGQRFLGSDEFENIRFFMGQIEGLSLEPRAVHVSDNSYMTIALKGGGKIIVNMKDDLSEILGNIATVVKDKSVAPSLSAFLDSLDYIKFDSGNKVVYKKRGE